MIDLLDTKAFLLGQLELYKIEFSETGNNKYLQVMNDLNKTIKVINTMDSVIQKLAIENKTLKQ
jgi:hypothetical protein